MVIMAINGLETLRQLGLLGRANFKAAKSLTAWEYLQQVKATTNDSQECCCFLGLKENKVSPLLKVSQWCNVRFQQEIGCNNSNFRLQ